MGPSSIGHARSTGGHVVGVVRVILGGHVAKKLGREKLRGRQKSRVDFGRRV